MVDVISVRVRQAELARVLNVSRAAISKAVKSGRITPGEDGLFDVEQAVEDWKNNTRSAVTAAKRSADGPKRERGGQPKYAIARARKEHHLANMAALNEQKLLGRVLARDDVELAMKCIGAGVRAAVEALPDQLAPLVGPVTDLHEVHALIADACRNLLQGIEEEVKRQHADLLKEAARKTRGPLWP